MQKFFTCLLLTGLIAACSKDNNEPNEPETPGGSLVGKWKLIEQRSDPGDGSGKWEPAQISATLEFKPNGSFIDSRDPSSFTRYERFHQDSILLSYPNQNNTLKLSIQQLTNKTLSYYFSYLWVCGGPVGEKWTRISPQHPTSN